MVVCCNKNAEQYYNNSLRNGARSPGQDFLEFRFC